jgi:hypothetical protein
VNQLTAMGEKEHASAAPHLFVDVGCGDNGFAGARRQRDYESALALANLLAKVGDNIELILP